MNILGTILDQTGTRIDTLRINGVYVAVLFNKEMQKEAEIEKIDRKGNVTFEDLFGASKYESTAVEVLVNRLQGKTIVLRNDYGDVVREFYVRDV